MNGRKLLSCRWMLPVIAALLKTVASANAEELPVSVTNDFTFVIHASLPPFRFHIIRATNQDFQIIRAIEVFKGRSARLMQLLTNETSEPRLDDREPLILEDANFDGYRDLRTINWAGATGNIGYVFWLFDTNRGRFEYSEELSDLCRPEFFAEETKIRTHGNGGAAGMMFSEETYVWENNRLKMIEQVSQDEARRPLRDQLLSRFHYGWEKYEPQFVRVTRVWTNEAWKVKSERVRREWE